MRYIKIILLAAFLYLLQIAVISSFGISGIYPNLILITLLIFLLKNKFDDSLIFIVFAGILLDIASPLRFGIFSLMMLMIYLIFNFILKKYISEPIFAIVFATFLISSVIFELPSYIYIQENIMFYLYTVIYDTILGIFLYYIVDIFTLKKAKTYYVFDK